MTDLALPGLLVDAQRILLVKRGASAPVAEVIRAEATWDDIALIRDLLLEGRFGAEGQGARPEAGGKRAIPGARRVAHRG